MPKLKLTKSGVDKLPYYKSSPQQPKKNQELLWDTEIIGFGLRVTEQSKTYIVVKRVNRGVPFELELVGKIRFLQTKLVE